MKLEALQSEWAEDSKIDPLRLKSSLIDLPKIFSKYWKYYSVERLQHKRMEADLKTLAAERYDFYSGSIDPDILEERGWTEEYKNFGRKVLKGEIARYLEADKYIIEMQLKNAYQKEKVMFLDDVIDNIKYRRNTISAIAELNEKQSL